MTIVGPSRLDFGSGPVDSDASAWPDALGGLDPPVLDEAHLIALLDWVDSTDELIAADKSLPEHDCYCQKEDKTQDDHQNDKHVHQERRLTNGLLWVLQNEDDDGDQEQLDYGTEDVAAGDLSQVF